MTIAYLTAHGKGCIYLRRVRPPTLSRIQCTPITEFTGHVIYRLLNFRSSILPSNSYPVRAAYRGYKSSRDHARLDYHKRSPIYTYTYIHVLLRVCNARPILSFRHCYSAVSSICYLRRLVLPLAISRRAIQFSLLP